MTTERTIIRGVIREPTRFIREIVYQFEIVSGPPLMPGDKLLLTHGGSDFLILNSSGDYLLLK